MNRATTTDPLAVDRPARGGGVRAALAYCSSPGRLKRTLLTAVVVGTVLTLVNHLDVIVGGDATTATYLKCAGNFLVPFIVSNVGLLIGRSA